MDQFQDKISVALCTFNGERFLARQLASIKQQTWLPYEVVVCDDGSADRTMELLSDFAASVSFPVRITQNEQNLGFVANFQQAIRLCEGDLIALSDQDDIWYPTRLETSRKQFVEHPEVGLVFSDADVMDDQDQLTGTRLWQNFGFGVQQKERLLARDYTVFVKKRFVTGATVMLRSRLRAHCLPVAQGWLHDEWLAPTAAAVSEVRFIEAPLIRYRRHPSQQVGLSPAPSFREKNKRHWTELSRQIGMLEGMCDRLSQEPLTQHGRALLACYQAHLQFARFRFGLPRNRLTRLPVMVRGYESYAAYGSGLRSMATDFVLGK